MGYTLRVPACRYWQTERRTTHQVRGLISRGHRPGIYHLRTGSQGDTSHVARRGVFIAIRAKFLYFDSKLSGF